MIPRVRFDNQSIPVVTRVPVRVDYPDQAPLDQDPAQMALVEDNHTVQTFVVERPRVGAKKSIRS